MAKKRPAAGDYIGKRGEAIAQERLMDFCGNAYPYFDPHFLGEKCPTYDLLVELIGAGPSVPYFLAQVKATHRSPTPGSLMLGRRVAKKDVRKMIGCPIPTYVIGIDEPAAHAYIVSIRGTSTKGIVSIPTAYPLDSRNLKRLWEEVREYWQSLGLTAKAKTSAFTL